MRQTVHATSWRSSLFELGSESIYAVAAEMDSDPNSTLFLARPFLAHGRERDQSEILCSRVRVRFDEAFDDLQHLFGCRPAWMAELEIIREHAAHERERRHDPGAAAAGRILRVGLQPGHAVRQHGFGASDV